MRNITKKNIFIAVLMVFSLTMNAQVGEHRNDLAVGGNVGLALSNVGFVPKVTQSFHDGLSGGFSVRYTSEKYFNIIASIYGEVNYSQLGWKENIIDLHTDPVIGANGEAEKYSRTLTYIQVPLMAHLAWGKEHKGMQYFFRAGPQFGYMLNESTSTNFDIHDPNLTDRANKCVAQYDMAVENRVDYGIAAGVGVEYVHPALGHFLIEGRYYYGLGNLYGASKQDYFGKSNNASIEIRVSYLMDLIKTKQ